MMTGRQRDDVGRAVLRLHESVGLFERVHEDRAFRVLLIAALNALDVVTTAVVLALGGVESNPVMQPVVGGAWWGPILVKAVVIGALWAAAMRCPVRSRVADVLLVAGAAFYSVVVGWNSLLMIHGWAPCAERAPPSTMEPATRMTPRTSARADRTRLRASRSIGG